MFNVRFLLALKETHLTHKIIVKHPKKLPQTKGYDVIMHPAGELHWFVDGVDVGEA
jgi:hypothetical protein